jgi:nucleoside-diphosphate-sugar epimerase
LGWSTDYLARIQAGKPIITHGDGNSFWVACHADDVARAFVHAVGKTHTLGKAYHVTGEAWMTWNQYHQIVAQAFGCQLPEVVHIPTQILYKLAPEKSFWAKVNFQFNNLFDNTLAKQDLDFSYTISWLDGARGVINSLAGNIKDDDSYDALIARWRELERNL